MRCSDKQIKEICNSVQGHLCFSTEALSDLNSIFLANILLRFHHADSKLQYPPFEGLWDFRDEFLPIALERIREHRNDPSFTFYDVCPREVDVIDFLSSVAKLKLSRIPMLQDSWINESAQSALEEILNAVSGDDWRKFIANIVVALGIFSRSYEVIYKHFPAEGNV